MTLKVIPTPAYSDPELAKAVSLGIGGYSENNPVTYKQFLSMLDAVVKLASPNALSQWKKKFTNARGSNKTMHREEDMLAAYFAAEVLGADYNSTNSEWWRKNERIGESGWKDFTM